MFLVTFNTYNNREWLSPERVLTIGDVMSESSTQVSQHTFRRKLVEISLKFPVEHYRWGIRKHQRDLDADVAALHDRAAVSR